MMSLRKYSTMLSKTHKWILGFILALAVAGFIDATYLTLEHYMGRVPPCYITTGCSTVTTSPWSLIFGIYVALYGSLYYLAVILFSVHIFNTKKYPLFKYLSWLSWIGLASAVYFTSIQAFIIRGYCIYCLLSAVTSTLIFILAQSLWYRQKKILSQ